MRQTSQGSEEDENKSSRLGYGFDCLFFPTGNNEKWEESRPADARGQLFRTDASEPADHLPRFVEREREAEYRSHMHQAPVWAPRHLNQNNEPIQTVSSAEYDGDRLDTPGQFHIGRPTHDAAMKTLMEIDAKIATNGSISRPALCHSDIMRPADFTVSKVARG